jgi:hypothetical protein
MCFFSKESVKGGSEAVRDAPAGSARRSARQSSFGFVDFVADGGVLILRRHAGTTTQAEQHYCDNGTGREFPYHFHSITSYPKPTLMC